MVTEAELEAMRLRPKKHQRMDGDPQKRGRGEERAPCRCQRQRGPADNLVPDSWPPEPRETIHFCGSQPLSLWGPQQTAAVPGLLPTMGKGVREDEIKIAGGGCGRPAKLGQDSP